MGELLRKVLRGKSLPAKQEQGGQSLPANDCFKRKML
jgi:hypothetical protein